MKNVLVLVLAVLSVSSTAFGEIPRMMSYQGKVTDPSGVPIPDGNYDMVFRIFDAPTGGSEEWNSGPTPLSVTVNEGILSILLGESIPIDIDFDEDYWLEVEMDGFTQTPRQRLGSVGYSFMSSGLVPGTEVSGEVSGGTSAAIQGTNTTTVGTAYGVRGITYSTDGAAVSGWAANGLGTAVGVSGGGPQIGVYGSADSSGVKGASESGAGVYGYSILGYGIRGESGSCSGVYGTSNSSISSGVRGDGLSTTGDAIGVYGTSASSAGTGIKGYVGNTTGTNYGGWFESSSSSGTGVLGRATATSGQNYGVIGRCNSSLGSGIRGDGLSTTGDAIGVYGTSASATGKGIKGYVNHATGENYGGWFESHSSSGIGVTGQATATSGQTYGVYGRTYSSEGYSGYFIGDFRADGRLSVGEDNIGYDVNLYGDDPDSRLFWDESKMALRAGRDPAGSFWNDANMGTYSFATGYRVKASGEYSVAIGANILATGMNSFAAGGGPRALGDYAVAMGCSTFATDSGSVAFGSDTRADGMYATAMGKGTRAFGMYSTAMGRDSEATADYATAIGQQTTASGSSSFSGGMETLASGDFSMSFGRNVTASGDFAIALGKWAGAGPADNTVTIGSGTSAGSRLNNGIQNSLIVGFNTTTPTLFVGGANHRVGIGFDNPQAMLHIEDGSGDDYFRIETSRFIVKSDGKVGIGTSLPGEELDIYGDVAIRYMSGLSSAPNVKIFGDVLYYDTSSSRHRREIEPYRTDFERILNVEPKAFVDNTTGMRDIGYMAEEFDELGLSNLVFYRDGQPQTIRHELISLYLIEIIKDLRKHNSELSRRVAELEDTLRKMDN